MNARKHQLGLSVWGLLLVIAIVAFVALIAVKCVPIYLNQIAVARAVRNVAAHGSAPSGEIDALAIRDALQRRWDVDYIKRIEPGQVQLVRDDHGLKLAYDYEAREHLFYNVFIVIHFAEDVPIQSTVD